jgi:hypothetical protein
MLPPKDVTELSDEEILELLRIAEGEQPGPARRRRREQFVQLPWTWIERLKDARGCIWYIAVLLLHRNWKSRDGGPIKLTNVVLKFDSVSRRSKWRALVKLEQLGLIAIERRQRKSPLIRINKVPAHAEADKNLSTVAEPVTPLQASESLEAAREIPQAPGTAAPFPPADDIPRCAKCTDSTGTVAPYHTVEIGGVLHLKRGVGPYTMMLHPSCWHAWLRKEAKRRGLLLGWLIVEQQVA